MLSNETKDLGEQPEFNSWMIKRLKRATWFVIYGLDEFSEEFEF